MSDPKQEQAQIDVAEKVAKLADEADRAVATAESLTSGLVAQRLGSSPAASSWFRGGLVSYHDEVKHGVLEVDPGPVVTEKAARQMAEGVSKLLSADLAISTTGAGGPDPQDDQPPGTVFIGVRSRDREEVREYHFEGDPEDVVQQATQAALELLLETLQAGDA
jgi:nicotinamide-nucleotide amidase